LQQHIAEEVNGGPVYIKNCKFVLTGD